MTTRKKVFSSRLVLLFCLIAYCLSPALSQRVPGQIIITEAPCAGIIFDAASVKPSDPLVEQAVHHAAAPGDYNVSGVTLVELIQNAYGVLPFQIDGANTALMTRRFDIYAKLSHASSETTSRVDWAFASRSQLSALRCLLFDRFKFSFQIEKKLSPVYLLSVEKNGPKFKSTTTYGTLRIQRGLVQTEGSPISVLRDQISSELDHIVLDETGLRGNYIYTLRWSPDDHQEDTGTTAPALRSALRDQLGLMLQNDKRPVDVIRTTHIESPSAN